jgi:hypothetical protein
VAGEREMVEFHGGAFRSGLKSIGQKTCEET